MVDRRALLKSGAVAIGVVASGCGERPDDGTGTDTRADTDEPGAPGPTGTDTPTDETPSPEAVRIAFIGDQGLKDSSRDVLRLIREEGADLVVHSGDFDYANDPEAWESMLAEELGADFPYVASIGNHDIAEWSDYRDVLEDRAESADGLTYSGDIGLQATYSYEGVTIVAVSRGVCDADDVDGDSDPCSEILEYDHEEYVTDELENTDATWRFCSWHMVNHDYQIGDKGTEVPASLYDAARRGGAMIATAHNHSYARTYPMSDFEEHEVASTSPPYTVGDGATFAFVSAAGGQSFYAPTENVDDEWWAETYAGEDDGNGFGAFFCTLMPDGTGECYFKEVGGRMVDGPFAIESAHATETPGRVEGHERERRTGGAGTPARSTPPTAQVENDD